MVIAVIATVHVRTIKALFALVVVSVWSIHHVVFSTCLFYRLLMLSVVVDVVAVAAPAAACGGVAACGAVVVAAVGGVAAAAGVDVAHSNQ